MDSFLNRVRKIRHTNEHATKEYPSRPNVTKFVSNPIPPGKGLKKIATSRKETRKKEVAVTTSNASTGSNISNTSTSSCNSSCTSDSINANLSPETTSSHHSHHSPVDSGIESTSKKTACQQDSNTSNGSVLSGHVNLNSELERRCQAVAKLAFREERSERKELTKNTTIASTPRIKGGGTTKIEQLVNSSPEPPITPIRRAAVDMNDNKRKNLKDGVKKTRLKNKKGDDEGGGTTDEGGGGSHEGGLSDTDTSSSDDAAFADDENDDDSYDSARGTSSGNNSSSPETKTKAKREPDRPEPAPRLSPLEQPIKAVKEKQSSPRHRIIDVPKSAGTAGKHSTSTSLTNRVQPTSRRVTGVTLRDLYSLRAVLSDSDNGTVFSGRRRIDNAAVAIKRIMKSKVKRWHMIKDKSVPMEIALLRKTNEARHPGVVTLLEWFECSDCFLLVMVRPTPVLDLFDYVSERKRLDEDTSRIIFMQVLEAMSHCHNASVLHRDIKLENVLVKTDTLTTTIIDFGCGTQLHTSLYKDFAGTPQYYPPEYYICKQYHGMPAAVWSAGVMLYAMLCGRLPFASAHEIVHLEPSWHGSFCKKISPAAKELVECMLKKQPRRRMPIDQIQKHRWFKNVTYDQQTGNVTIITADGSTKSTNDNLDVVL